MVDRKEINRERAKKKKKATTKQRAIKQMIPWRAMIARVMKGKIKKINFQPITCHA